MKRKTKKATTRWVWGLAAAIAWLGVSGPGVVWAAEDHGAHESGAGATLVAESQALPAWQQKFKEQLEREDAAEGHEGHRDQVEAAMKKLMDEVAQGTNQHGAHTAQGPYSDAAMAQQMDKSYFLGPATAAENVTAGGHCPNNVPVKEYDVSAINVEIT
ncbi:MAG: hypothetical protein HY207_08940, partial [Nitrospirae bacterium]|nr:hypothetical protein [Nitrospirota bacterium]